MAGHFKLDVDGSRNANDLIGAGGVIRDSYGVWCFGFMQNIGVGEVLNAEAWGMLTGLKIAVDLKISHLEVESDSSTLINLLHCNDVGLHLLGNLLANCNHLIQIF